MSENDLSMIELVLIHLNHCWGPPWWFDALKSVPVLILAIFEMAILGEIGHFQACRQWSPRVVKSRQGSPRFKRDLRVGWDELEPNRSYLNHFPTWYSKLGHFPIEIPIKNENGWYPIVFLVCGPIIHIRMGSPSFEAKFQLWGKTEQAPPMVWSRV